MLDGERIIIKVMMIIHVICMHLCPVGTVLNHLLLVIVTDEIICCIFHIIIYVKFQLFFPVYC